MLLFILGVGVGLIISGVCVVFMGHQELEKHKRRQITQAQRKLRKRR
jgi:hypothetical protein